jgi:hypothetical protein
MAIQGNPLKEIIAIGITEPRQNVNDVREQRKKANNDIIKT